MRLRNQQVVNDVPATGTPHSWASIPSRFSRCRLQREYSQRFTTNGATNSPQVFTSTDSNRSTGDNGISPVTVDDKRSSTGRGHYGCSCTRVAGGIADARCARHQGRGRYGRSMDHLSTGGVTDTRWIRRSKVVEDLHNSFTETNKMDIGGLLRTDTDVEKNETAGGVRSANNHTCCFY